MDKVDYKIFGLLIIAFALFAISTVIIAVVGIRANILESTLSIEDVDIRAFVIFLLSLIGLGFGILIFRHEPPKETTVK